jgi:hypothetical protein
LLVLAAKKREIEQRLIYISRLQIAIKWRNLHSILIYGNYSSSFLGIIPNSETRAHPVVSIWCRCPDDSERDHRVLSFTEELRDQRAHDRGSQPTARDALNGSCPEARGCRAPSHFELTPREKIRNRNGNHADDKAWQTELFALSFP